MRLLIIDLVRRSKWRTAFFSVLLVGMLWVANQMDHPGRAFAVSMGVAFAFGPQLTLRHVPRAIWYLPVSRRDVWRAGWLVATVGATLVTTLAKLLTMLVMPAARSSGISGIALSSLYDFLATGVGCGLVIAATRPLAARAPWRQAASLLRRLAEAALPLGFLGIVYGGFLLGKALPTHWSDLTARSGLALAAGLALTIGAYFYSPSAPARVHRPARPLSS